MQLNVLEGGVSLMSKKRGREPKASDERRSLLGVAWYRRDNWERLREISSDREALEDTYEEWLANAEASLPKLARQGMAPVKVHIDIEEGGLWGHIFICQKLKEAFSVRS
jgi:hypothetical protein